MSFLTTRAAAADHRVAVAAGDFDRRIAPVAFDMPAGTPAGTDWELVDEAGVVTPVQNDGPKAVFILTDLKANQTKAYTLRVVPPQAAKDVRAPPVMAVRDGGAIRLTVDGSDVLTYRGEKTPLPPGFAPEYQRGGYISPVQTPSGAVVTDDYPPGHKHHHGVWSPWTKTEFEGRHPDFWNMGDKTGTVEFVAFGDTWSGPVFGGFSAKHRFVDLSAKPDPKPALNEEWQVRVYRVGGKTKDGKPGAYFLFDWQSTQTTASDSPLTLPQYHYGGLGFRGRRNWDGKGNCDFLTSEGKTRENGNESRGKWCRITGDADGKPAGVAILCPPDDFRFPQPMRIHPTEPFFCYAPEQLGEFRIEPGKLYVAKYRFVVADGEIDKAEIDRLWNDYAKPPGVEVK